MTANDSTTRVVSDSGDDIGPGQRLREAREAAQLTLAEVASRMRLEPHVLESLEGDHYERLHGPTFVRGYLSGYARLLDLPERPILEAYERHDHRPPTLVSELGRKPEVHVSDFPVRMVTYVIAGLLVVLVVLWWQSRQVDTAAPERADVVSEEMPQAPESSPDIAEPSAPPAAAAAGDARSTQPAVDTTPSVQAAQPSQPPAESTAAETAAGGSEQASRATVIEAPVESAQTVPVETAGTERVPAGDSPAPAPAGTESAAPAVGVDVQAMQEAAGERDAQTQQTVVAALADGNSNDSGAPTSASGTEEQATAAPRPAPLPGSDRLAIRLARESWVEIYDRGGGRLYYSLASEGSEVVVEGAGPMRVLLGEIEGAAVAYNGEPFDLSRYQGRSVVRFTVGELSSTTTTPEAPAPASVEEPLTRETPPPPDAERENAVADAADALAVPAAATAGSAEDPLPATADTPPQAPIAGAQPDS